MADARKDATITKIWKNIQKLRPQRENDQVKTTGYEDEMGDNVEDLEDSDNE